MTARNLIRESISHFQHTGTPTPSPGPLTAMFHSGAQWMHDRMHELEPSNPHPFNPNLNYTAYGLLKYGTCMTGFVLSIYNPLFLPLSIAVFYLIEIHFLFLFPLLLDNTPRPIQASIRTTYQLGLLQCFITVIPIAGYMLIGLFRRTNRTRNWYIGCLAILIWYKNRPPHNS